MFVHKKTARIEAITVTFCWVSQKVAQKVRKVMWTTDFFKIKSFSTAYINWVDSKNEWQMS